MPVLASPEIQGKSGEAIHMSRFPEAWRYCTPSFKVRDSLIRVFSVSISNPFPSKYLYKDLNGDVSEGGVF